MTWKIDGKIAAHFPGAGVPNRDTYRIVFSPVNAQQTSDLEEIEKVYYIPSGSTVSSSNLQNYLVWKRYWEEPPSQRTLHEGDKCVAIEIDLVNATENLVINSIEIFTSQHSTSTTSTSARIHIYYANGIEIAQITGDGEDNQTERYSLTGYPRYVNGLNITLYKGYKYYIAYNDANISSYYPAYFQNENGNYKEFNSVNSQDDQCIDEYKKVFPISGNELTETDLQQILQLNQYDKFAWIGNNIVVNYQNLIRGNYLGIKQTTSLTANKLSENEIWGADKDTIFIWHNKSNTDVSQRIYKKTADAVSGTIGHLNPTGSEDKYLASVLLTLKNGPAVLETDPAYWFTNTTPLGSLFKLKDEYSVGFSSDTPSTSYPSEPQENTFYYLNISGLTNPPSVYLYKNNTYTFVNKWGGADVLNYIDATSPANIAENVSLSTYIQEGSPFTRETTLANATLQTNRKYYLKINGNLYPQN